MPIPDYESIMLPLLQVLADGEQHKLQNLYEKMAQHFNLNEEEKKRLLPSGRITYIVSRTGWAKTYLKMAGLVDTPRRGYVEITDRGREVLSSNVDKIDNSFLERYPEFLEFKSRTRKKNGDSNLEIEKDDQTPEESLEENYKKLRAKLGDDLLENVRSMDPYRFERMVIDLLISMGYGSALQSRGFVTQASNDEGVDGLINEDKLGLDKIYIQAKRYKAGNNIGRPEIQKFAGALDGQGATKGVFITTSGFSRDARDFAHNLSNKTIVLVDGEELAELMIDSDVGVSVEKVYRIKKVDSDYFEDE